MAYVPGQNGGPPQPPHQPQVYYVPQPIQPPGPSIDRVTVPFVLVVSAGAFIAWASWFGTTSINAIQSDIKSITVTLNNYIDRQDERVDRLETALDRRTAERWTKNDQALFCAKTEAIPGNKGWKCGETENGRATLESPSIWNGHLGPTAPVADVEPSPAIGRWSQPKVRATP
jgi:hypothetical protein